MNKKKKLKSYIFTLISVFSFLLPVLVFNAMQRSLKVASEIYAFAIEILFLAWLMFNFIGSFFNVWREWQVSTFVQENSVYLLSQAYKLCYSNNLWAHVCQLDL